jgi:ABC-type Fe3+/spermidine/putrescine transport system ATPase subunit
MPGQCACPRADAILNAMMKQQRATSASDDVIRLAGVTKTYQAGAPPALADVTMGAPAGEVVAVMGPSGSGKSTLLNLVAGLDRPTAGTVTVAGRRIDTLGESALARFRARHVGIIFQFFNLLDDLTVKDNLLLPAQIAGVTCWIIGPAIVAAVLAAPAAVALNKATLSAMAATAHTGVPASFTQVFPPSRLALLSLAALVIAVAGALLPASWAGRARPATALRAE